MMKESSSKFRKLLPVAVIIALTVTAWYGLLMVNEEPAIGAASVGSIIVTGGSVRNFNGVNYLLDGNILVSGSGSRLTFTNSTITLSQDVGLDGEKGGGDDHIYNISVMSGGALVFINSKLTTQTGQINPYFSIDVRANASGSRIEFRDSRVEGPGTITIIDGAGFVSDGSLFTELMDKSSLSYDIDGDGSTEDDVDYNDDGPLFTFSSGSSGLILDSELRDTFSFSTATRDGLIAGNITVEGSNTNLTVINSFMDVDMESNRSTGTHNMLKVKDGASAYLVGVSVNVSASSPHHPAFLVPDTLSKIVYYRWIGARVLDGMGIQVENQRVTVNRIEGSRVLRLTGSYLTSDILDYMGRNSLNWNRTSFDGWAFIPVITDLFTRSSMPNSDSYPDFRVFVSIDGETVQASTRFQNYPGIPDRGNSVGVLQKARNGETVDSKTISLLGGSMEFEDYIVSPSSSSFFSDADVDLTVNGATYLRGTSAMIDGVFYPSYYAFNGHLIVRSGGHLVINDTRVSFLTDESPAYILVENGGILEMNNVSLGKIGEELLYVYVMGTGNPTLTMDRGSIDIGHLVARDNAAVDIHAGQFNGSLNLVGSGVDVTVSAGNVYSPRIFARDCSLHIDGNPVHVGNLDWSGIDLRSYDSVFDVPLDIDNYALLTNVTFSGTLPDGRSGWLKPVGPGVIARAWWVHILVRDSVRNPLPGSTVDVQRVDGNVYIDVSNHTTDDQGRAVFALVQDELRTSGRTFLGNYRLSASFRGYSSNPMSTLITGSDVDAIVTIPGGPNLQPVSLSVEGTLIDGFPVTLVGNITNLGEFDAGSFDVGIEVNGERIGRATVPGLASGSNTEVKIDWLTREGNTEFALVADDNENVNETVEDDNVLTQFNYIGIGPDYSVVMENQPTPWAYNTESDIDLIVSNVGEDDPEETGFYVNVTWVSGLKSGIVDSYISFDYISPDSSVRRSINWTPAITGLVNIRAEVFSKYDRTPINSFDTMVIEVLTLPDLRMVLNSFQVEAPVPVTINTTVDVTLSIENIGELPAGDFMVALYDTVKDLQHMLGNEALVPGLQPEEVLELSFAWTTGIPVGYHDIIVSIDPIGSVREMNRSNNEVTIKVMVDTPPDLTFTDNIGASPLVVTEGKNVTFWATVKNVGRTKAMNALIHFSIDSDTNLVESRSIDLSPGQERNISFGWNAEGLGLHTLFIVADYWDTIKEPVENNNLRSLDFRVISKPDLFMNENDLRVESDGKIEIGESTPITAAVRNSGETDAYNVFIRFYDGDPDQGGKIISWKETQPSVSIDSIPSGGVEWVNVTWTPTTGGYHDIFVVLDLVNAIDESNEANNKVSWSVYVQTLPDLVFSDLSLYQGDFKVDSAGVGKTLIINATLENQGDTNAPAFKVNFYNGEYSNDPEPLSLSSDVLYLGGILKGNSKMNIEMPWRVGYPKGVRTIIVVVQLIDGEEQSTANNRISTPIEIFDLNDVPELLPLNETLSISSGFEGMDIDMETNPVAFQGMNLSLDLDIDNNGGKAASNISIVFVASNSTDSWVEYRTGIPFIENNGTDHLSGFWNLRDLGTNTLRIIIDPDNTIREFDEGNNIITLSLDVKEAPDITVTLLREGSTYNDVTGQFDMVKGKEYEVSFRVQNLGNYSFTGLHVEFDGPAQAPLRTINLAPYSSRIVTFTVKPDIGVGEVAIWRCKVNADRLYFESNNGNNQDSSVINVLEQEKPSKLWIVILFIVLILFILAAVIGYFLYRKIKTKDMAKCSNCGGLVELDATVCPHCGIEFSDELECECGAIIPAGATVCPSCGRPIAGEPPEKKIEEEMEEELEGEETGEPEEIVEITEEQEAPEALEEVEEVEDVIEEAPAEEELAECFECGALIPVSAPICPHCGAVFE